MERTRYNDFDVLRALIIVSAFILHYDLKIGLGTLVMPSLFIQRYVFTVGGFFFFVAGYMARTIYLPAFAKDAAGTSARIFVKGLKILTIYLSYVFLMRVCTGSSIPGSFIPFVYDHAFTMIILFTFSLLFMLTPLILYCAYNHPKAIVAMLTAMILFVILYNKGWPLSFEIKKILIDRTLSAYPLLPALMVYAFGYGAGSVDGRLQGKNTHIMCLIIGAALIVIFWHFGLMRNWKCFTLVESITPYVAIVLVRQLLSWESVQKCLFHPMILCVGINSLSFYVISNIMVGLLQLTHHTPFTLKLIAFLTTGSIAYLLTYWYHNSSLYVKSLNQAAR